MEARDSHLIPSLALELLGLSPWLFREAPYLKLPNLKYFITMATTNFIGVNPRSINNFLNEQNADAEVILNPKNQHIFLMLTNGTTAAVSEAAQEDIKANGFNEAKLQVVDMPGKDAVTGMPNGSVFFLVTLKGSSRNTIATLRR